MSEPLILAIVIAIAVVAVFVITRFPVRWDLDAPDRSTTEKILESYKTPMYTTVVTKVTRKPVHKPKSEEAPAPPTIH